MSQRPALWMELRILPPPPNQVNTRRMAVRIRIIAKTCFQKPLGSSCCLPTSLLFFLCFFAIPLHCITD